MEWRDKGLIIGGRRYGETSVILESMTRGYGRHLNRRASMYKFAVSVSTKV